MNFSTHNGSNLLPPSLGLRTHCRTHSSLTKTKQLPLTDSGRISNCYFLLFRVQRKRLSTFSRGGEIPRKIPSPLAAAQPTNERFQAMFPHRRRAGISNANEKPATSFEFLIK